MVCDRIPNLVNFASEVTLPTLSVPATPVPTPLGVVVKQHGDRVDVSDLQITFTLDEDWTSYVEAVEWMFSYVTPKDMEQYKTPVSLTPQKQNFSKFADITIYSLTNKGNQNFAFNYKSCHPSSITAPTLTTTNSSTAVLTFSVTFEYDYFEIGKS